MLSKLPKLVLLTKLLPFLDEDELNKVASICKVLRKLVYSPMGLKIIVYNRTRRMAEYFRDNVMAKASYNVIHDHPASYGPGGPLAGLSKRDLERAQGVVDSLKEDQAEEIQSLRNVKKFLTEKLDRSKVTLELMQKEMVVINDHLQQEKKQNRILSEKLACHEEVKESSKEVIRELNMKYVNIVKVS